MESPRRLHRTRRRKRADAGGPAKSGAVFLELFQPMESIVAAFRPLLVRARQVVGVPRDRIAHPYGEPEQAWPPAPAEVIWHRENLPGEYRVHHEWPVRVVALHAGESSAEIVDEGFRVALIRRKRREALSRSPRQHQPARSSEQPAFNQPHQPTCEEECL